MSLPIAAPAEALGLEVLPEALVERGPRRAAGVLLVAPQVQLALEEFIALLAAESGVLCKTKGEEVSGRARHPLPWGFHPTLAAPTQLPSSPCPGCSGAQRSQDRPDHAGGPHLGIVETLSNFRLLPASLAVTVDSRRPCLGVEKEARPCALFMN